MTYENLEYWTRQLFSLSEQDLSFYATDVDVCPGTKVTVHRNAYDIIGGALGVLHVEASKAGKPAVVVIEDISDDEPRSAKTSSQSEVASLPSSPAAPTQAAQRAHRRSAMLGDDLEQVGGGGPSNVLEAVRSPGPQQITFSAETRNPQNQRYSVHPTMYLEEPPTAAAEQWLPPRPTSAASMRGDQQSYRQSLLATSTPSSRGRYDAQAGGRGGGGSSEGSDDDKVEVIISHRPTRQSAKFKARPHMKVARVTYGVCKAFGLDYQTARLHLIVRSDTKSEDYTLECDQDDSMANIGLQDGMVFLISVDGDPI
ncbi:hypothetical protein CONPUDRAFT_154303 [Coniophora puteana RWD-64-598 SS2]|uniref:Uncharacterized protein n=1 Tax=Coniophora puteana (strain RWD-64-598) TaxID=741705 RepID=A0A5M3MM63_CONPW|nr:uncharacterized protein CONPUDRAFT_154303 [Coniophora puteana RWD-64-598 SS2]EIW80258.1 hypothetical protein CONPUDRAFT_154303 [Coniophora puteana RWD-64-598 SS2]